MAGDTRDLESVLQCPICLDLFENPHILKCLHTLCKECVDQLIKSSPSKSTANCPECRQTSKQTEIKKDFNKQTLLDIHNSSQKNPSPKQKADVPKINNCEICNGGVISWGCMVCVKLMCDNCKIAHPSIPACKRHVMQDINTITKPFKDQLHMAVGAINQAGQQLTAKQTEITRHAQNIHHAQTSTLKQIDDTEKAFIEETKKYFKSLKTKVVSKYQKELEGAGINMKHIKKGLGYLESRHKEFESVLSGNDYRKVVYHTKGACQTIKGEVSKMDSDLAKIHLNTVQQYYVKCDRMPDMDDFVSHNLNPDSNEGVFLFQARNNQDDQPIQTSSVVKPRDKVKSRLFNKKGSPKSGSMVATSKTKAATSESATSSSLFVDNFSLSYFSEGEFVLEKNVVVKSSLDQYFKIRVIGKELWCTLSDRIEIYDLDGEYMRTLHSDEFGNPYAVTHLPETSSVYLSSVNGLFELNSNDQVTNVLSKDKFIDITITQGKLKAICAIDMWKQRAVAYSYQNNNWCKAGEISLADEISNLHDTVVSTSEYFWVGSHGKSTIFKHNIQGKLIEKFNVGKPHVCTTDSNELVLCVDETNKSISILDSTGNLVPVRIDQKDLSPVYCSVDHDRALWVLSNERPFKLLKFVKCVDVDSGIALSSEERDKLLQVL